MMDRTPLKKGLTEEQGKRALGCLYALAVGDAFGARYEFKTCKEAQLLIDNDYDPKSRLITMKGGGKHGLRPGQITDDTQMALCLTNALLEGNEFSQETIARHYVGWYESNPIDCGNATGNALNIDHSNPNHTYYPLVHENAEKFNKWSLSNGPLMRIAPLAVYGLCIDEDSFEKMVISDCTMTHPNTLINEACVLYAKCLRIAILTGDPKLVLETALRYAKNPAVVGVVNSATHSERPFYMHGDIFPSYIEADGSHQGYFSIALHCALFECLNSIPFERSMERIARKGGDTDTNCAIAGALLGALGGDKVIPTEWITLVSKEMEKDPLHGQKWPFNALVRRTVTISRKDV